MNKKLKITNSVKYGTYSLIAMAVVLAIIIVVNLAVAAIPSKYTAITNDAKGLYNISSASEELLSALDDEITFYVIATQDQTSDYHLKITEYLRRYAEKSDKIKVENVDPVLRPSFVEAYTSEELDSSLTHIIAVNDKTDRSYLCDYSSLIASEYDPSLSDEEQYYYYLTYGTYKYISTFNVENALISAITYVTMEKTPAVYYTSGHGETALDTTFKQVLSLSHVENEALDLALTGKIPEDADCIIIYAPTKDFSESEISLLAAYAKAGGNIVLCTGYNTSLENRVLKNLYSFIENEYGLSYQDAIVFEGDKNYAYSYVSQTVNNNFYPQAKNALENVISGRVLFSNAHPIIIKETLPEGVSAAPLFVTTDKGYAKTNVNKDTPLTKEESDLEGSFTVGAEAEREYENSFSRFLWFSSVYALNIDGTYSSGYQNIYIPVHIMEETTSEFSPATVSSISLDITPLNVSKGASSLWGVIIIGIVPLGLLGFGFALRHRRVRR